MWEKLRRVAQSPSRLCAGVMSGTSLDGIDVAICRIQGQDAVRLSLEYFETIPYMEEEKTALMALCAAETGRVDAVCEWNKRLGVRIGEAVRDAVSHAGLSLEQLDFVASHGQTIHHMPQAGATLQIGELADIAAVTGCPVVGDFRPSDMAYGGEGAPLIPYVDWVLYRDPYKSRILINIGGIANLTALPAGGGLDTLLAFDTGPGNVLSDHLVMLHTGGALRYDEGGALALSGNLDEAFLAEIAAGDTYLPKPPPKSTGREHYTLEYAQRLLSQGEARGLALPDILATVADYTTLALADGIRRFVGFGADEVYLSGGGLHNAYMMRRLRERLGKEILPVERLGMVGDAKEAAAFALLGDAFLRGAPNNAPRATGADRPVVMGKLALPTSK